MAKKKQPAAPENKDFNSSPFRTLKGFAVSAEEENTLKPTAPPPQKPPEAPTSFAEEMELLGVERLTNDAADDEAGMPEHQPSQPQRPEPEAPASDAEQFLAAMGELEVRFNDSLPEEDEPQTASARRMKQLKQGKLVPEASLDLHGLQRVEVAAKLRFFLQDALYQGWRTVLVITGKGLHSDAGEPVLRQETERFLAAEGRKWVIEWSRAPKHYGGSGALVLFLRRQER